MFKIFKNPYFWLGLILFLGFAVRLYKIDSPVADWHSWRQADTAAVARNFYKEGYNPLIPKYDDMSGVAEKPVANPNRYRFVEFPIYNSLVYFLYLLNGGVDEKLARLVSIFMSLGSTVFLFLIVRKYWGKGAGLLSAFIFAMLPYNIYFSRVILPEPTLVFFSLGMFFFVDVWIQKNTRTGFFLSVMFTSAAFLIKPQAVFYLLPLAYSYYQKEKRWWPIPKRYWYFIVISLAPFMLWRIWMSRFPEGIPASNWLFNGNHIRFRPAFWKWIIGDRIGGEILSVTGLFLFILGLIKKSDKGGLLLHLLALSLFLFLIVFATGNVQHDYYQTLIVPALAIFTARGFILLINGIQGFVARIWTIPLGILFFILTFYLSWQRVSGFYQINNPSIVEAGLVVDRILPKNAVVLAPYQGDSAFLYQTNRPGWAITSLPIKDMIDNFGVTNYVSVNYDAKTKWIMARYQPVVETPKFVIVDLTKRVPGSDLLTDKEPTQ